LALALPYLLALMSTRGYAEDSVAVVVRRAEELLSRFPEDAAAFNLMFALWIYYHTRGTQQAKALQSAERLVQLSVSSDLGGQLKVFALAALANSKYVGGNVSATQALVDEVCREYVSQIHAPMAWQLGMDAWVSVVGIGAIMDWMSGDLLPSYRRSVELTEFAIQLGHPESRAHALFVECVLSHCKRDRDQLARSSQELAQTTREHRLHVFGEYANLFQAYVRGDIKSARLAFGQLSSAGHVASSSYQLSLVGEIEMADGRFEDALECVNRGIEHAMSSGEGFWLPRLLCQRALVFRALGHETAAVQSALAESIADANRRGMTMFELEASVEYARASRNGPLPTEWSVRLDDVDRSAVLRVLKDVKQTMSPHSEM